MTARRLVTTGIAVVVGGACVAFVVAELVQQWDRARDALADAHRPLLGLALLGAAAGMTLIAAQWRVVVRLLGGSITWRQSLAWYYVGEVGKYVPGGIWPVLGRAELHRRGGEARAVAYSGVALSLVLLYLAGAFCAAALVPVYLVREDRPEVAFLLVVGLVVGLLALHDSVLDRLVSAGERLLRRELGVVVPRWAESVRTLAGYAPAWVAIATTQVLVARALDPDADLLLVAFASLVSWVAGFAAIPVPGGVGVREAVFVALAGLPPGVGVATAVVSRLLFVVVDTGGAALGAVALRRVAAGHPEQVVPVPDGHVPDEGGG